MKNKIIPSVILAWLMSNFIFAQHISTFSSLPQSTRDTDFYIPSTHVFQYIIEHGDDLTEGGSFPDVTDFTGYVPISNSSNYGYLSINSEATPGGVTILDIELDGQKGEWVINSSQAVDFSSLAGTISNCSGTVTPWNTIITCEETTSIEVNNKNPDISIDSNGDGYDDLGWAVEIDPATKKVIDQDGGLNGADKLWAMGNFKHENAVIHENKRTVYQGADNTGGEGFLFKFVADREENLSSGNLYVFKGDKQGSGGWIQINNNTIAEQNSTLAQCADVGATNFGGIEDVEIDPIDGLIYFAVKSEDLGDGTLRGVVYRFKDTNPINGAGVENMIIYAGGDTSYNDIPWGNGTDNLVFDDKGNLWVAQDEGGSDIRNYIWVIERGHTQLAPIVKIFARTPLGCEPTGLTFSPDYKYLFMSIQHPASSNNSSSQPDAFGNPKMFDNDVSIVISRMENLNNDLLADKNDIMISQYYHDETTNSKWIEIKNNSNQTIPAGSYFLNRYDDASAAFPLAFEPIPEILAGNVILFKNSQASLPNSVNLGQVQQIETSVCDFDGDDLILISTTPGAICYDNRTDIIGGNPIQNWGKNRSLIRGGNLEDPSKIFNSNSWIVLDSISEINFADPDSNLALGTHSKGATKWNNGSWDSQIPDRTRNVEIIGSYLSGDKFKAYNLMVDAELNFDNGSTNSVVIYNNLTVTQYGTFVIGDKESLVMVNDNAEISGMITKKESSTARNNAYDITYWSSPVENESIGNVFEGVTPDRIFYYDKSKTTSTDPMDFWIIPDLNETMKPGLGYASEGLSGLTEVHDISFSGIPNNGEITYILQGDFGDSDPANDYNLIGNPYPSAIDIDLFFERNAAYLDPGASIDPTAYFWTHTTPLNGETGDYVSTDYAAYNKTGGAGVGDDPPSSNVGSGQGFFVRAIHPGTVVFNNSMRIPDLNFQFFKANNSKSKSLEKDRIWLDLTTNQGGFNQLLIGFLDEATDGFDNGYDALKLEGGNPIGFYSVIDEDKFIIQGLGSFSNDKTVSLGFNSQVAPRTFTINIDQVEGRLKDVEIYLFDKELNETHNLKESSYQFEQINTGEFPNRFTLSFTNTALDIETLNKEMNFTISNSTDGFDIGANEIIEKIKVYDLLGRLLIENTPNKKNFHLDTDRIQTGTILIIESTFINNTVLNKKTIKY